MKIQVLTFLLWIYLVAGTIVENVPKSVAPLVSNQVPDVLFGEQGNVIAI
jgi:hypothetical protein